MPRKLSIDVSDISDARKESHPTMIELYKMLASNQRWDKLALPCGKKTICITRRQFNSAKFGANSIVCFGRVFGKNKGPPLAVKFTLINNDGPVKYSGALVHHPSPKAELKCMKVLMDKRSRLYILPWDDVFAQVVDNSLVSGIDLSSLKFAIMPMPRFDTSLSQYLVDYRDRLKNKYIDRLFYLIVELMLKLWVVGGCSHCDLHFKNILINEDLETGFATKLVIIDGAQAMPIVKDSMSAFLYDVMSLQVCFIRLLQKTDIIYNSGLYKKHLNKLIKDMRHYKDIFTSKNKAEYPISSRYQNFFNKLLDGAAVNIASQRGFWANFYDDIRKIFTYKKTTLNPYLADYIYNSERQLLKRLKKLQLS